MRTVLLKNVSSYEYKYIMNIYVYIQQAFLTSFFPILSSLCNLTQHLLLIIKVNNGIFKLQVISGK